LDAGSLTIAQLIELSFCVRPPRVGVPIVGDPTQQCARAGPMAGNFRPPAILAGQTPLLCAAIVQCFPKRAALVKAAGGNADLDLVSSELFDQTPDWL
jgi:hypothetical protein